MSKVRGCWVAWASKDPIIKLRYDRDVDSIDFIANINWESRDSAIHEVKKQIAEYRVKYPYSR